jgi:hypothetical protein
MEEAFKVLFHSVSKVELEFQHQNGYPKALWKLSQSKTGERQRRVFTGQSNGRTIRIFLLAASDHCVVVVITTIQYKQTKKGVPKRANHYQAAPTDLTPTKEGKQVMPATYEVETPVGMLGFGNYIIFSIPADPTGNLFRLREIECEVGDCRMLPESDEPDSCTYQVHLDVANGPRIQRAIEFIVACGFEVCSHEWGNAFVDAEAQRSLA